jgi:hypothetical protein
MKRAKIRSDSYPGGSVAPPIHELNEKQLLALLENDPEADRLLGHLEAALTDLRRLAGKAGGDAKVSLTDG